MRENEALKKLKSITLQLSKIRKKCQTNGLWLSAGFDGLKDSTDEAQQGPMITKLFQQLDEAREYLKGK
jgi:hypothetical protein